MTRLFCVGIIRSDSVPFRGFICNYSVELLVQVIVGETLHDVYTYEGMNIILSV